MCLLFCFSNKACVLVECKKILAATREARGGDGAGAGLEADVLVLLPVPAGHGALHAGALGADCVQFHAGFHRGDGTVHGICLHASAHHGDTALLRNCTVTNMWPSQEAP